MPSASSDGDDFGGRVHEVRRALGFSQGRLAEELGVTLITIHRWEAGKAAPQPGSLRRLAELEAAVAASSPAPPVEPGPPPLDFAGDPRGVSAFTEALCLAHGHEFNPAFAIETARIDPLPHQRIAVYERMLAQDPLRFLLADDAGAGKTIMTGLLVRELLSRRRIRRVLIVPPAGLVGNWERELRTLFHLQFGILGRRRTESGNPFLEDQQIVSLDTLRQERTFQELGDPEVAPYDLVVFDEAHKLSVGGEGDRVDKTKRYQLAEALSGGAAPSGPFSGLGWSARHLLLLTATPHMGRERPYHFLWRLLDPQSFSTGAAVTRLSPAVRRRHFLRRTKEELVGFDGAPLFLPRRCNTFSYQLSEGPDGERDLYERTTEYLHEFYGRALTNRLKNRPAVELALTVFQRRLASSTWALLRSFERRIEKLRQVVQDIRSDGIEPETLLLDRKAAKGDLFEIRAADDDAGSPTNRDREEIETWEDEMLGALAVVTEEEVQREIGVLEGLRDRARRLHESGQESKFQRLREVLEGGAEVEPREKWLIFSEHRDTVDSLIRRLEGLGYSGQVAEIHGGMDWPEREEQVERFRDPAGARFLIATDAAGEGINLQFCRLMVNYDIPWNPARLEQRMGRIHRYGQKHEVRIVNLISKDTREGRVLAVLLEKLDAIREELESDKVFDVIGRLFEGRSLKKYLRSTLWEGGEEKTDAERADLAELKDALRSERVRKIRDEETRRYGDGPEKPGEVAARLTRLNRERDREESLRLLPAYVLRFVERSAPLLGLTISGDLDGFFTLLPGRAGALDPLLPALDTLAPEDRELLSARRIAPGKPGVWLHPGEPVFDALSEAVRNLFSRDAQRGAIFADPRADGPYFFHLGLVGVEAEVPPPAAAPPALLPHGSLRVPSPARRIIERRLIGLRQEEDGMLIEEPVERMLLLHGAPNAVPGAIPLASRSLGRRAEAAAQAQEIAERLVGEHRARARRSSEERRRQLTAGFDLRAAELAEQRKRLRDRLPDRLSNQSSDRAAPDEEAMREVREEQAALASRRTSELQNLREAPDRIHPGEVLLLAHALVIPAPDSDELEGYDETVEAMAVRIASEWERAHHGRLQDVSKPEKARAAGLADWPGFDLLSIRPDGEQRRIEVKGRAGRGGVSIEPNEWKQACHFGEAYWLYVVFDCGRPRPELKRIQNPFRLLTSHHSSEAFSLSAGALREAAEPDP